MGSYFLFEILGFLSAGSLLIGQNKAWFSGYNEDIKEILTSSGSSSSNFISYESGSYTGWYDGNTNTRTTNTINCINKPIFVFIITTYNHNFFGVIGTIGSNISMTLSNINTTAFTNLTLTWNDNSINFNTEYPSYDMMHYGYKSYTYYYTIIEIN